MALSFHYWIERVHHISRISVLFRRFCKYSLLKCLFIYFLNGIFCQQKLWILIETNLFIFLFFFLLSVTCLSNICLSLGYEGIFIHFSWKALGLYILVHDVFQITFCLWCEKGVEVSLVGFHMHIRLIQHHFLKRLFLPCWLVLAPLSETKWLWKCGPVSRLSV